MVQNIKEKLRAENRPSYWSDQINDSLLADWMGKTKKCPACGRMHAIKTKAMVHEYNMTHYAGSLLAELGFKGRCLVVMDKQTSVAAGEALLDGLSGFDAKPVLFERDDLHADEQALGTLLTDMAEKPDFLISCGSGTLTDITRYNAYMADIPFAAFATAASVDGFASGSTPLLVRGFKTTYPGIAPDLIMYDPAILATAPQKMTAAGYGDVLAKIIALLDWQLAYFAEDEAYCPLIASFVDKAVKDCLALAEDLAENMAGQQFPMKKESADKPDDKNKLKNDPIHSGQAAILSRKEHAVCRLMDALSLTGIAMQMMGTSRPASGSDHHISHLLEMRDIQRHKKGSLHGDKVGIGTLIGMTLYLKLFEGRKMPVQKAPMPAERWEKEVRRVYGPLADQALTKNDALPPQGAVWDKQKAAIEAAMEAFGYDTVETFKTLLPDAKKQIESMGGPVYPAQLGYSRQDTYDAIAHGKEVRPKFTTLRLAERFGHLYDLAEEIADGLTAGRIY